MAHRFEEVLSRGMCIGCGSCAVRTGGRVFVELGPLGIWQANAGRAEPADLRAASQVCPFSDDAANEDALAAARWPGLPEDGGVGRWRDAWAGRVCDDAAATASSSGGLTTYLLRELLSAGDVDAVIHVGRAANGHFEYQISSSTEELLERRKSDYTSVTFADVLTSVREDPRRFAIVGVPCFIRAARLLADADPAIDDQLAYYIGLVCGHLKTQFFAESLAWQAGIEPEDLGTFDFRVKVPGRPSSQYAFRATRRSSGEAVERPMSTTLDGGWGFGAFQPEACNFCDDIFAETADVVFADAWLPEYTADWRGTNIVVSRSARASELLLSGAARDEITLEPLSLDKVAASQAGNFRHRRDGLRVRLADDHDAGLSIPRKRVEPGRDHVTPQRVRLIRQRRSMSANSLEWFAEAKATGDLSRYTGPMAAAIAGYRRLESSLLRRVLVGVRRRLQVALASARHAFRKYD